MWSVGRVTWLSVLGILIANIGCSNEIPHSDPPAQNEEQGGSELLVKSLETEVGQDLTLQIECLKTLALTSGNDMVKFIVTQPELAMAHKDYAPENLKDENWERLADFYEFAAQECLS